VGELLVLLLALLNSALYCCLLPLWEGFDEPFHYGYVESISVHRQIPVLGQTTVSEEVRASLALAPISFILKRNIPGTIAFEDWFSLSRAEQAKRIEQLRAISPEERQLPSPLLNYEAQQAPLAYLLLAPIDATLSGFALPTRILILRLLLSLGATILIFWGCCRLCDGLELHGPFRIVMLAVFFKTQIFEAAIAHVANDWLSITAAVWFFAATASLVKHHRTRDALLLAVVTAGGLLSKAYFLAFVPIFAAVLLYEKSRSRLSAKAVAASVLVASLLAGPWYLRNLLVYKTLADMQESVRGVSSPDAFYAFHHIPWGRALLDSARWSLWTGNESHLSFSQSTLTMELLLWLAALGLFAVQIRKMRAAEVWTLLATLLFAAALLYDLCVTWVDTHGLQATTGPYYAPCILPAILALACLGLQRSGAMGRILAMAIGLVAAWIAALTYMAKLVPYYSGFLGRSTAVALWNWWTQGGGYATLSVTAIAPVGVVYLLLVCFFAVLVLSTVRMALMLKSAPAYRDPFI